MLQVFREFSRENAEALEGEYDIVVVHDPQPIALPLLRDRLGSPHWIWRCHLDLTEPDAEALEFIRPYLAAYDAAIATHPDYRLPELPGRRFDIAPCIDPLDSKNRRLEAAESRRLVQQLGREPPRLITQVARFDPWKDPLGAIDAYRLAKREFPDLELALVGAIADDDPQGWDYYERTCRHAGEDFGIHILQNYEGVDLQQVNAFQTVSDAVIQASRREGFGLTVTEACWKKKAVIARDVGGIRLQVVDGQTGFLVDNVEELAARVVELLRDPEKAAEMGREAAKLVRRDFLAPRLLRDYLRVFQELMDSPHEVAL